jgi:hypothetical protein
MTVEEDYQARTQNCNPIARNDISVLGFFSKKLSYQWASKKNT